MKLYNDTSSDSVHIDDAIHRTRLTSGPLSNEQWERHGYGLALLQVRIGDICTDADAKVDRLYRALADIPLVGEPHPYYDRTVVICPTCGRGKDNTHWPEWDDPADYLEHADGCVYVEAIEYVANISKEQEQQ